MYIIYKFKKIFLILKWNLFGEKYKAKSLHNLPLNK